MKLQSESESSREIKMFANWINSLGLKDVLINYLIEDLKTGKVLLKIIERLSPGSVDWEKRYSPKLNSRIHIIQNCNYALELCEAKLGIKLVNIQGLDIVDGKENLVLGLIWQLCNVYWTSRVGNTSEKSLVEWGNSLVPNAIRVKNLEDPSLASGQYLLYVIEAIAPHTVDP